MLALASSVLVAAAWAASLRAGVSRGARIWARACLAAVALQVGLGVATLLSHVPVPLAAAHQAGAIALLTCVAGLYHSARTRRLASPC